MKAVDITRRAEQSAIERFPVFTVEQADANYDMRMEHGYAFELGATWMKSIASQPAVSEGAQQRYEKAKAMFLTESNYDECIRVAAGLPLNDN